VKKKSLSLYCEITVSATAANINVIVFDSIKRELEPMIYHDIYHTQGGHANHNTIDAVVS
jgi:hypothetical protein